MRLHYFILFFFSILFLIISCSPEQSKVIVANFGKYDITLDEFETAYSKNAGGFEQAKHDSISEYKDFLDLYLNFKMKLRDAEVRGYPRDKTMMDELNDYKKTVGVSYIIEKDLLQPGIEKLYERRKDELRVSHIMIRPDTSGEDAAREIAQSILDSIKLGGDFEELAEEKSHDRFSAPSGGDIYYVTSGILPYEFEDAMYETPVGEVYPNVLKTRFGFHLITVTERIPRIPKIKASHILVNYFNEDGEIDSSAAELTADSVLVELNAGVPFEELVEKYSDDTGTKGKGGDLGYFERRMMVQPFDEVAFNMEIGEISDPVQTNFGYHIIKLVDKMEYPSIDDERDGLKEMFKKQRYDYEYNALIDSLRKKFNFRMNEESVDYLVENSDSIRFGMVHPRLSEISDKELFTYSTESVNIGTFLELAKENSAFTARAIFQREQVVETINKISEDLLMEEEALYLENSNPEFAALMNDYRDGIFIFKLQEEEVWNKVRIDSIEVYNYWEANREEYSWPDRISFGEIFTMKDTLIQNIYRWLQEGADFDSLAAIYTERPGKKQVSGFYELQDVDFSDFSRQANVLENLGDFTVPVQISGGYSVFQLKEREPARLKTFTEAKAEVSGEYQETVSKKLENEYIRSLKLRYEPDIFYDELQKAFKPRESS